MRVSAAAVASTLAAGASAQNYLGFNSGATKADRSAKFKADFEAEFKTAQNLEGAPGTFNAVRLYTNIQAYSETSEPIEAFEAAIDTKTHILLGVWASGTDSIEAELKALKTAVQTHGKKLTDLVIGVSIGSEDLYRDSETGVKNEAGVGASPDTIIGFVDDFKKAFANTALSKIPVGHVDTWDVWTNSSIKPVIDAIDFLGIDEYPYYENDKGNDIKNSGQLFDRAYEATINVAGGKPVWVTETGWPYVGPEWDEAVPSITNAQYYWQEIGCRQLFNKVPTFWYTLRDSNPDNKMKFAITKDLSTKPMFDLKCPKTFQTPSKEDQDKSSSSSSAAPSSTKAASTVSVPSSTPTPGGSGSGSGNGTGSGNGSSSGDDSNSGNGSGSGSGSGSGNGEQSNGGSGTEGQNPPAPIETPGAASSMTALSTATYAGLALVAGFFAFF
jgi:glucan endo-1,3-beta-D-glucosidase